MIRDERNKILGGVCSGIAAYIGIEPIIVRLVFIFSGIGFIAYILLWIFVPGSNQLVNGVVDDSMPQKLSAMEREKIVDHISEFLSNDPEFLKKLDKNLNDKLVS